MRKPNLSRLLARRVEEAQPPGLTDLLFELWHFPCRLIGGWGKFQGPSARRVPKGPAPVGGGVHQSRPGYRMFDAAEDDPPPPATIDPDSIQGRLTLIEERLRLMSIELDSLKARTDRRRHRAVTKQQDAEKRSKSAWPPR